MSRYIQNKYVVIAIVISLTIFTEDFISGFFVKPKTTAASVKGESVVVKKNIKIFNLQELKKYNGTNPNLAIYLALDGNVYDVTAGKEYYKVGGPYHSLAGKDSSVELHEAGGGIIKAKYPIVGKLVP